MSPNKKSKLTSLAPSPSGGELVLYRAPGGEVSLDVRLEKESVWLSLDQMASLFDRDKSVISRHLRGVFLSRELSRRATVAKNATVQIEGTREVTREIEYFNLDAIISVGYRVNSKRGTQFRIWATSILRDHILKGYTVNEKRLTELKQAIRLVADLVDRRDLSGDEAKALLRVVNDYSQALDLLDDYDHQSVQIQDVSVREVSPVTLKEVEAIVKKLRGQFNASSLFGQAKDAGLASTLGAIMQTFDGSDVYPSFEEKAANLLYLVVKNHAFVDGNKRIAAAVFLWFLEKNQALYREDGTKRIAGNALVAMTLLVAESKPQEKDLLVRVLINLINKQNV